MFVSIIQILSVLKNSELKLLRPLIPKPNFCRITEDVYSNNGEYLKSFCLSSYADKYKASKDSCFESGMRLYKLDTTGARSGILNYFAKDLNSTNKYQGPQFISGTETSAGCPQIKYDAKSKTYVQSNGDCSNAEWFICEYINIEREFE
jgi:hypothetical protein